jgi:flavodoxin/NAD-dependent dihydropyrimidine dehydrogenase PreA subunit
MKSLLIYYSQTGSTKKIARAIHRGMSQLEPQCQIAKVKDVDPKDLSKYDLIGLGSPIWMGGLTPNVRIFLEGIPKQNGQHIFSFCTHGVLPELYFPSVVRKLNFRGFTVIGTRDWYGDYHHQLAPSPYYTAGHPDDIDLKEAEDFGKEMVENSRRITAGETELIPSVPDPVLSPQLLVLLDFYQSGHNPHGQISYDKDKCVYPKCTLCMDNCLMKYIDLSADPQKFGSEVHKCDMWMGCTFCELICPTGAISGNWDEIIARQAEEPAGAIVGYNLLEKRADDAVAEGRLRMLVPREDIRWDRPYIKVHSKRPRLKLPKDE